MNNNYKKRLLSLIVSLTILSTTTGCTIKDTKKESKKNNETFVEYLINDHRELKSIDEIAQEVIERKWGDGEYRKYALTTSGYDYDLVMDRVNEILSNNASNEKIELKSNEEIAEEVINGFWGNDEERKNALTDAGYNYNEIQSIVNDIIAERNRKLYGNVGFVNCNSNVRDINGNVIDTLDTYQKIFIYDEPLLNLNINNESLKYMHICIPNMYDGYIYIDNITSMPNTYVEVDISDQKLYVFVDGELSLEANVITGNPNQNNPTDLGYTEIYDKRYKTVLEKYNSYVDYFMSFNYTEGFHDADAWRSNSEFDIKDYYLTNGSHGCVNMKQDDVEALDGLVSVGTKVLVHK